MSDLEIVCWLLFVVIILLIGFFGWLVVSAKDFNCMCCCSQNTEYWQGLVDSKQTDIDFTIQENKEEGIIDTLGLIKKEQAKQSGYIGEIEKCLKVEIPYKHKSSYSRTVSVNDAIIAICEYLDITSERVEEQKIQFKLIKPKKVKKK